MMSFKFPITFFIYCFYEPFDINYFEYFSILFMVEFLPILLNTNTKFHVKLIFKNAKRNTSIGNSNETLL